MNIRGLSFFRGMNENIILDHLNKSFVFQVTSNYYQSILRIKEILCITKRAENIDPKQAFSILARCSNHTLTIHLDTQKLITHFQHARWGVLR